MLILGPRALGRSASALRGTREARTRSAWRNGSGDDEAQAMQQDDNTGWACAPAEPGQTDDGATCPAQGLGAPATSTPIRNQGGGPGPGTAFESRERKGPSTTKSGKCMSVMPPGRPLDQGPAAESTRGRLPSLWSPGYGVFRHAIAQQAAPSPRYAPHPAHVPVAGSDMFGHCRTSFGADDDATVVDQRDRDEPRVDASPQHQAQRRWAGGRTPRPSSGSPGISRQVAGRSQLEQSAQPDASLGGGGQRTIRLPFWACLRKASLWERGGQPFKTQLPSEEGRNSPPVYGVRQTFWRLTLAVPDAPTRRRQGARPFGLGDHRDPGLQGEASRFRRRVRPASELRAPRPVPYHMIKMGEVDYAPASQAPPWPPATAGFETRPTYMNSRRLFEPLPTPTAAGRGPLITTGRHASGYRRPGASCHRDRAPPKHSW